MTRFTRAMTWGVVVLLVLTLLATMVADAFA